MSSPREDHASPVLEVRNLVTRFDTEQGVVNAVNGVSFTVDAGRALAIVGESGCGKSVTALSIMGLVPGPRGRIESGEVLFGGRDLLSLSRAALDEVRGRVASGSAASQECLELLSDPPMQD